MNRLNAKFFLYVSLFITFNLVVMSCSVSNKNNCGCPAKKGLIGY